jgi:hypothetical protein
LEQGASSRIIESQRESSQLKDQIQVERQEKDELNRQSIAQEKKIQVLSDSSFR